jgi:hypothetical protein
VKLNEFEIARKERQGLDTIQAPKQAVEKLKEYSVGNDQYLLSFIFSE